MIKSHSVIKDDNDNALAIVITESTGINSITNVVCKPSPSFEGQEPLTVDELKKAGIDEGTTLYKFSNVHTVRKMTTTATSKYNNVTGITEDGAVITQTLYVGEKLSAMAFMANVRKGYNPIAKAQTVGIKMKPVVEVGKGVNLLAAVLMGYTLAGSDGVGALAGAGVI